MILRIALLLGGLAVVVFMSIGAVDAWSLVFTEGAGATTETSGFGGTDRGEGPAWISAIVFSFFGLLGAAAVGVSIWSLTRSRRDG